MWIAQKGREAELAELAAPQHTALVVIDIQNDFCHLKGAFGVAGYDTSTMPAMAKSVAALIAAARRRQMLIIFVRAIYDEAVTSRVLASNRLRRGLKFSLCLEGTWGAEWFGEIQPRADADNEVVITKHRFDAFQGTPLDLYLRSGGIRTIVAVGTATSGCVESTVRNAFFHDYAVIVPPDCVADPNFGAHDQSLAIMETNYARLVPSVHLIERWHEREDTPLRPPLGARREALVLVNASALHGTALEAMASLLAAARARGVLVLHVRSAIPVVAMSAAMKARGAIGTRSHESPQELATAKGEFAIVKHRSSAFADTSLAQLLRTNFVDHVVLAGASAMGDIDITARDGIDRDLVVEIAQDAVQLAPEEMPLSNSWHALLATRGIQLTAAQQIAARWAGNEGRPAVALAATS